MEELKKCPFCGDEIGIKIGLGGLRFFKCKNKKCGAIVSFDNDYCNNYPEKSVERFNKRVE